MTDSFTEFESAHSDHYKGGIGVKYTLCPCARCMVIYCAGCGVPGLCLGVGHNVPCKHAKELSDDTDQWFGGRGEGIDLSEEQAITLMEEHENNRLLRRRPR